MYLVLDPQVLPPSLESHSKVPLKYEVYIRNFFLEFQQISPGINSSFLQMIACISPTATPELPQQQGADAANAINVSEESKSIHFLGKVTRKAVVTPIIEATSTPQSHKSTVPKYPTPQLPVQQDDEEILEAEDVEEGFGGYVEDDL